MAAMCAGLSRMARMPPAMVGCRVLTRPSSISGNPVTSLTSATGMPASRSRRAVPPVEISSAPMAARPEANSMMPVLSVTLSSTQQVCDLGGGDAGSAKQASRAAGGDQFGAHGGEAGGEFDDAGLIGDAEQYAGGLCHLLAR